MKADLSNLQIGTGRDVIAINGTAVKRVNSLVAADPASGVLTTYMPIWYLMNLLDRLGIQHTWNGSQWEMTAQVQFFTYAANGASLGGPYATLDQAKSALANQPGAYVKDSSGQVVYTQGGYAVYNSPQQAPQVFANLTAANQAAHSSQSYVVDLASHKVVKFPQTYYYLNSSGQFVSNSSGWMGGPAPSFAQPGERYVAVDPDPGNSPHAVLFYRLTTADGTYSGQQVGTYENPFRTADLRFPAPAGITAATLDQWFQANGSPLQGLGASFLRAQQQYGVNAAYLAAHAVWESAWGKSAIAQAKNNYFGYGAYDADPMNAAGMFPSADYAIQFEAWAVRNNYLDPNGLFFYQWPSLDGMNEHYATDPNWAQGISVLMAELSQAAGVPASAYVQSNNTTSAPSSPVTSEPVFWCPGATGTLLANPYVNLPVWSDPGTGADQMYPGVLQSGDSGYGVKLLQRQLNAQAGAHLSVDGAFGPMTQQALQAYQQTHGLAPTGVCDIQTWRSLFPTPAVTLAPGTAVTVDQMRQGLVGDYVTLWYHIQAGAVSGWVDSQYVALTNVYRVTGSASSFPVYAAPVAGAAVLTTLHSGDFVVSANPAPTNNGWLVVQIANQQTGQAQTGYLAASTASLQALPAPAPASGS
ncbi:MAG: glucosaminidase domain-containing protein [Thermoflavifilum sp.]|nr:glucosaminidase domain-containing protein [Thermoflavifilum sp.]